MRVDLTVTTPADLLARYYPNGKLGGLTLDGPSPGTLGERLDLRVVIERPRREFDLWGQLAWVRHQSTKNLKGTYGVDFLQGDDASQRLLALARQDLRPEATRSSVRLATDLPVRITHLGQTRREVLIDLSDGGAFVRSPAPLEVGQVVELHLRPPGSLTSLKFKAWVKWTRPSGRAPGMGLEFYDVDEKVLARLSKMLAKLERR